MTASLLLLIFYSEPLSGSTSILFVLGILTATVIGFLVGGYIFVRIIASVINIKRDTWHHTANELGLTIDQESSGFQKNMTGIVDGYPLTVSFYSIPKGEASSIACSSAEVSFTSGLHFSFNLERREAIAHKLFDKVFNDDVDFAGLGYDFELQISDRDQMTRLLNVEMLDGERPTLLGDINAATRDFHRVIISDRTVKLGRRSDPEDAASIKQTIKRTIDLAERIKSAAKLIAADS